MHYASAVVELQIAFSIPLYIMCVILVVESPVVPLAADAGPTVDDLVAAKQCYLSLHCTDSGFALQLHTQVYTCKCGLYSHKFTLAAAVLALLCV